MRTRGCFLTLLAAIAITGCGGGGSASGSNSTPIATIQGVVFASAPFSSGLVSVYDFSSGAKGALLSNTVIGVDGSYQTILHNPPAAVLLDATGCYAENVYWFNGGPIQTPGVVAAANPTCLSIPLNAVRVLTAGDSATVMVTPYTHAAYGRVQYEIAHGTSPGTAIADGNSLLTHVLGFDVLSTQPIVPAYTSTVNSGTVYGGLLYGLASWIYNEARPTGVGPLALVGTPGLSTLDVAEAMRNDLAYDGVLNGQGTTVLGGPAALSISNLSLSSTVYRHGFAAYGVIAVRSGFEYTSGGVLPNTGGIVNFLPSFQTYNNSTAAIFDGSSVVALDEGGPVVGISWPSAGTVLTGSPAIDGTTHDITGFHGASAALLIDGVFYDYFADPYHTNHFINTTVFPNGSHILTIRATNNLGTTKSASVTVTFSN